MHVRSLLTTTASVLALGGFLVAASVNSAAAADKRVNWKMGSAFGSKLTQLGTLGVSLSEKVQRISGGNIRLKFFEPNALVPPLEMFDAISAGSLDAAWSTSGYWVGKNEAFAMFSAVPFGPSAGEYGAWIYYGGGKELMDELYAPHGIKSITCGVIAPEASGWFRKEITSTEDLKGLKMRFFGLGAKVMEKMGVSTQLLAGGDIFPALERGSIDATEFSMPAIDLNLGFYQVAKHYYFPGWHQQSTLFELMMNREKWDALSDLQKAQIETACGDNFREGMLEGEAIQFKALQELQSKGVTIHRWDPAVLDELRAAWNEVANDLSASNPDFKKVWASLSEFRENYKIWKDLGYLN
ncbi:TRAP transporter substrate-binding protein [Denitrobaculum tricleocarpae]|uniref:TRAP transporter substrate-binding protein n=1 Tax=Denitrobaculum tricleocarpae TaxID=2591009 RepID=A0A545TXE9_9PROT|nr:TRAP transporter substrate-binding protein [Denitrobaculum tricleocarpae]TQV81908.1 TRAP transporter substrate-binding protein [Denitrobaculum tricleocarpae]